MRELRRIHAGRSQPDREARDLRARADEADPRQIERQQDLDQILIQGVLVGRDQHPKAWGGHHGTREHPRVAEHPLGLGEALGGVPFVAVIDDGDRKSQQVRLNGGGARDVSGPEDHEAIPWTLGFNIDIHRASTAHAQIPREVHRVAPRLSLSHRFDRLSDHPELQRSAADRPDDVARRPHHHARSALTRRRTLDTDDRRQRDTFSRFVRSLKRSPNFDQRPARARTLPSDAWHKAAVSALSQANTLPSSATLRP